MTLENQEGLTLKTPIISACICTHNGADRLEESLWSLVCQSAPAEHYEIVVIDNASSDPEQVRALIHGFAEQGHDISLAHEPRLGLSAAKNRALRESNGSYIYFMDDDAAANPRLIESYLQAIREYKPDVMGGHVHPLFDELPPPEMDYGEWSMWSLRHFGPHDRWLSDGEYFLGGNLCVCRDVLEGTPHDTELGRMGGELRGGEEWYLGDPRYRRRLVSGGYIFHRVPEQRTQMDYVLRVMCGPSVRPLARPSMTKRLMDSYLLNAWSRSIVLSCRKVLFQLRLALASRSSRFTRVLSARHR